MKIQKGLLVGLVSAFLLGGCSSFQGEKEINSVSDIQDRVELTFNTLQTAPYLSTGTGTVTLYRDTNELSKRKKVVAPPAGSVLAGYQDIAATAYDGFLGYTSTETEAGYLLAASEMYKEKKDASLQKNMQSVANRIAQKSMTTTILGSNKPVTLVYRNSNYDFDTNKWVEYPERVYTEDVLMSILALEKYQEATKDSRYNALKEGLYQAIAVQQELIKNGQKSALSGALYNYLFKEKQGYTPASYEYPFEFTWVLMELKKQNERKYGELADNYLTWVDKSFKQQDMFIHGIPKYVGLDNYGQLIGYKSNINTTTGIKTVSGLASWDRKAPYLKEVLNGYLTEKTMNNWWIPLYVNKKGNPSFEQGERSYFNLGYLSQLFRASKEDSKANEVLLEILNHQRLKGSETVTGTWSEGTWANYEQTFLLMYILLQEKEHTSPLAFLY